MNGKTIRQALTTMMVVIFCFSPVDFALASSGTLLRSADWYLTATDAGLAAEPKSPSGDADNLFDVARMAPGDALDATVTLRNQCDFPLSLRVEIHSMVDVPTGAPDLARKLVVRVYRNGVLLTDFPNSTSYYPNAVGAYDFTGEFNPATNTDIRFEVSLSGAETDNEYQETEAELRWVFTATRKEGGVVDDDDDDNGGGGDRDGGGDIDVPDPRPPVGPSGEGGGDKDIEEPETPVGPYIMPKTGEPSLLFPMLTGSTMAMLGAVFYKKDKKRK